MRLHVASNNSIIRIISLVQTHIKARLTSREDSWSQRVGIALSTIKPPSKYVCTKAFTSRGIGEGTARSTLKEPHIKGADYFMCEGGDAVTTLMAVYCLGIQS
jgi:hypothetical protein